MKIKSTINEHLAVFGCFAGLFILWFLCVRLFGMFMLQQTPLTYTAAVFVKVLPAAIALVLYIRWAGMDTFRLKGIDRKVWLYTFLLCFSQFLTVWTLFGYPVWINESNITYGNETALGVIDFIVINFDRIFCGSVINAILYRGLLQKQLSKILPPWMSVLIVSLFVACDGLHTYYNLLPSFLSGIFVGIIYHKTGKLVLCMLYYSFFYLVWGVTRFSFEWEFALPFFILAITFAVYAIRGFMKEKSQDYQCFTGQQIN
jgi:membrane protease YdiL (CAAX protease family)